MDGRYDKTHAHTHTQYTHTHALLSSPLFMHTYIRLRGPLLESLLPFLFLFAACRSSLLTSLPQFFVLRVSFSMMLFAAPSFHLFLSICCSLLSFSMSFYLSCSSSTLYTLCYLLALFNHKSFLSAHQLNCSSQQTSPDPSRAKWRT